MNRGIAGCHAHAGVGMFLGATAGRGLMFECRSPLPGEARLIEQFRHGDFVEIVANVLEESGMSPLSLHLELTESLMMTESGILIEALGYLAHRGITALPLHDSVLVAGSDAEEAETVMNKLDDQMVEASELTAVLATPMAQDSMTDDLDVEAELGLLRTDLLPPAPAPEPVRTVAPEAPRSMVPAAEAPRSMNRAAEAPRSMAPAPETPRRAPASISVASRMAYDF